MGNCPLCVLLFPAVLATLRCTNATVSPQQTQTIEYEQLRTKAEACGSADACFRSASSTTLSGFLTRCDMISNDGKSKSAK